MSIPKHCRRKISLALKYYNKPGPFERSYGEVMLRHAIKTLCFGIGSMARMAPITLPAQQNPYNSHGNARNH